MSSQIIGLIAFASCIVVYLIYRRYVQQQSIKREILQHINAIRQHQVLIKPDKTPNTFSGKFVHSSYFN